MTNDADRIAITECAPYSDAEVADSKQTLIDLSKDLGGGVNPGSILHEHARLHATIEAFQGEVKRLNEEVRVYMESDQWEALA